MSTIRQREWTTADGARKSAWVVSFLNAQGRRQQRTFPTKRAAGVFQREQEDREQDRLHRAERRSGTVGEICEAYLRHCEDRVRDGRMKRSTYTVTKSAIDHHILPALAAIPSHKITPGDVEAFHAGMLERGLLPSTAKDRVGQLATIEDYAIRVGYTFRPAARLFHQSLKGVRKARAVPFTKAEAMAVIEASADFGVGYRYPVRSFLMRRCFVLLAGACGLRYGEICGLTLSSIEFDAGQLRIRHGLDLVVDELGDPKTRAGVRTVPMPDIVAGVLRSWIRSFFDGNARGLVFRTHEGTPVQETYFRDKHWIPLLRQAGVVPANGKDWHHFHALRHFAASWMIAAKMPVADVASILGHASISTTLNTYVHPMQTPGQHLASVAAIEASYGIQARQTCDTEPKALIS